MKKNKLKKVVIIIITFLIFLLFNIIIFLSFKIKKEPDSFSFNILEIPSEKEFNINFTNYLNSEKEILRLEHTEKIKEEKISKLAKIFKHYGGYLTEDNARTIIESLDRCGGDYKVLAAIAGNESGYGRINYKKFNPFGYLNGVMYENQTIALEKLSCIIANQYLNPCSNDIHCISSKGYTGNDSNVEDWINKINFFIRQLENI